MNSGIYTIENVINKKLYVGYTDNFKKRFYNHKSHLNRNVHGNEHLQKAWNKYGKDNFKFEVLSCCSEEFLVSEEHYWCNMLDVHNPLLGYNIQSTNPEKRGMTNVDKLRISNKLKALNVRPIVMLNLKGEFIKEFDLVSDAADYLGKVSPSVIHRVLTGSRKRYKNYLFVYKNDYNPNDFFIYKDKRSKSVLQYDLNNKFMKEWNSTMDIERELSICNQAISKCCRGEKHYFSAGSYIWKYKN